MVIAIVVALVSGGSLVSQLIKLALGTVDWAVVVEGRIFWKETLAAAINVLLALGV